MSRIHSLAGLLEDGLLRSRPFRAPHHTTSLAGLVGGGAFPRPGEVSLAHLGVLFLDELAEFHRPHLEALRQPLEDGRFVLGRAAGRVVFPAEVLLVAATNPCPCGWHGERGDRCRCTRRDVARYHARISGPLRDRFDLEVRVNAVDPEDLVRPAEAEGADVVTGLQRARQAQVARAKRLGMARAVQRASAAGPPAARRVAHARGRARAGASGAHARPHRSRRPPRAARRADDRGSPRRRGRQRGARPGGVRIPNGVTRRALDRGGGGASGYTPIRQPGVGPSGHSEPWS